MDERSTPERYQVGIIPSHRKALKPIILFSSDKQEGGCSFLAEVKAHLPGRAGKQKICAQSI